MELVSTFTLSQGGRNARDRQTLHPREASFARLAEESPVSSPRSSVVHSTPHPSPASQSSQPSHRFARTPRSNSTAKPERSRGSKSAAASSRPWPQRPSVSRRKRCQLRRVLRHFEAAGSTTHIRLSSRSVLRHSGLGKGNTMKVLAEKKVQNRSSFLPSCSTNRNTGWKSSRSGRFADMRPSLQFLTFPRMCAA